MMDYSALEAAIRSARLTFRTEIAEGKRTGTEVVACEELLPPWKKEGPDGDGKHPRGEACTKDGQAWKCCQEHDTNNNPGIAPGISPAQWVPWHTKDPARAKPFIQPTNAEDSYYTGECCVWTDGKVYRSVMETANAFSPTDYAQGWEVL